ncbi:MAG: CRISPR-associated exonuclease Cas4 [Archaeoglobaceae archaeon]|nr:CRISPR-associated exonuclease Cas4 [Archaeoglobaceae archaeon]
MIRLSHITSYLTCPRLAYYRYHFGEEIFSERQAVREIYLSLRRGLGTDWAKQRILATNKNFKDEIFERALNKFVFSKVLEDLRCLDWDVVFTSEDLGVSLLVDEIVEFREERFPLFVSLNAPKEGVWLPDQIRAGVSALITNLNRTIIYYAYSGEIRVVDASIGVRRRALKLIERLKMIKNGFMPKRNETNYCKLCSFAEDCKQTPETFASKFL